MLTIIKHLFIFWSCIYAATKLSNAKIKVCTKRFLLSILPLTLAILNYILKLHIMALAYILPLLILWLFLSHLIHQPRLCFIATTIAFLIGYGLFVITNGLILFITSPIYYSFPNTPYDLQVLLSGILHIFFTLYLFRLKRFRKGMPFLFSTTFINVWTIVGLIIFGILLYVQSPGYPKLWIATIILLIFILTLAFLIFWWQAQLTKSYKRALQLRELESLRLELQEKDKLITSLTTQNEQLGKLIHRDNKLIPAMNNAVCEYLISDTNASQTMKTKGDSLLTELRQLSENRTNILSEIYANKYKSYETSVTALDTLLNYMEKRANQEDIHLAVHIALDLKDYIPHIITSGDLVHLLSDLLENAFIATNHCMTRNIQLQFYVSQKVFIIEVADNGIPFEAISLINLGITKMTTHADTGGSGIGLMDIWEIKEKYGASLHITEYENAAPYSKKIAFLFNRKNRYSVSTWRKDNLLQASKRTDLQVYTHEND